MTATSDDIVNNWVDEFGVTRRRDSIDVLESIERSLRSLEHMISYAVTILAYIACFLTMSMLFIGIARADDLDIAATQAEVNRILGTDVHDLPAVEFVDRIPGYWGDYSAGLVRISREAPEGCRGLILAHEVSHHVAIKAGLLAKIPNDISALKAELERLAYVVEDAWPGYAPNCTRRKD